MLGSDAILSIQTTLMHHFLRILSCICLFLGTQHLWSATHFVDSTATGGESTGFDWANAFLSPADALAAANAGDSIWIAAGNYTPGSLETDTFLIGENVALVGGFGGFETMESQSNPVQYPTILSGDIGTLGVNTDNSDRVVTVSGNFVKIFGLIIEEGNGTVSGTGVYAEQVIPISKIKCLKKPNL
jgi:hypothetical protein